MRYDYSRECSCSDSQWACRRRPRSSRAGNGAARWCTRSPADTVGSARSLAAAVRGFVRRLQWSTTVAWGNAACWASSCAHARWPQSPTAAGSGCRAPIWQSRSRCSGRTCRTSARYSCPPYTRPHLRIARAYWTTRSASHELMIIINNIIESYITGKIRLFRCQIREENSTVLHTKSNTRIDLQSPGIHTWRQITPSTLRILKARSAARVTNTLQWRMTGSVPRSTQKPAAPSSTYEWNHSGADALQWERNSISSNTVLYITVFTKRRDATWCSANLTKRRAPIAFVVATLEHRASDTRSDALIARGEQVALCRTELPRDYWRVFWPRLRVRHTCGLLSDAQEPINGARVCE